MDLGQPEERGPAQHAGPRGRRGAEGPGRPPAVDPQEAAEQALAAIDPSTEVSVGRSATIAGRDAYELVLEPRDATSLVGQIKIAIDAGEHVPLRFQIVPQGTRTPAFEIAFTQVDFDRPDPAQFTFNPPPGTKVTEEPLTADKPAAPPQLDKPTIVGTGWTTVLVARVPELGTAIGADADEAQAGMVRSLLDRLPKVTGEWGSGRLLSGKLFTALATDDGRVLIGAVTPERLYDVAQNNR